MEDAAKFGENQALNGSLHANDLTVVLMRLALDRSSAAQQNVTGRVSGRHARLPKTHEKAYDSGR